MTPACSRRPWVLSIRISCSRALDTMTRVRLLCTACAAHALSRPPSCLLQGPLTGGSVTTATSLGLLSTQQPGVPSSRWVIPHHLSAQDFCFPSHALGAPASHSLTDSLLLLSTAPSGAHSCSLCRGRCSPDIHSALSLFSGRSPSWQSPPYPPYLKPQTLPICPSTAVL